jgi:hypothetical protein
MAVIEVRDHVLWIKHIRGDPDLSAALSELSPATKIRLSVGGLEGEWCKMGPGMDGRATPGFKPIGAARTHWHDLQAVRGAEVPIEWPDRVQGGEAIPLPKHGLPSPYTRLHTDIPTTKRLRLPEPVARIYAAVEELEAAYPGRKFTPDGHLVGSIGEVIAAEALGLRLHSASHPGHDAVDAAGRQVQIKLTSGRSVGLYSICDRLVVMRLVSPTEVEVVFDGSGEMAWSLAGLVQKNGQRMVSLSALRLALQSS